VGYGADAMMAILVLAGAGELKLSLPIGAALAVLMLSVGFGTRKVIRTYPAVDIFLSGTRREELLLQQFELEKINLIRRGLAGHKPVEAIERLLMFVKRFPTNAQMLKEIPG
jgi:hypothetical protein